MLIGITGCKGSGKDTVGQHLVDDHDFTRLAFADKLKEAAANLFGMTIEQVEIAKNAGDSEIDGVPVWEVVVQHYNEGAFVFSWREFLQRFGTEMGRKTFGQDFWVQQWEEELYRNSLSKDRVVATDVRFPNEAYRILHLGGVIMEISRPGHEPDGHESEEPLQRDLIDTYIDNSGTIDELKDQVDYVIAPLLESR